MTSPAEVTNSSKPAGQVPSALDADALTEVLCRHKHQLADVFKRQPMILAHALKSLDDDNDVLHKFLCKHSHVVGTFLEKQKDVGVVAGFLAKFPSATYQVLDAEPAIIENYLSTNPEALQVYLDTQAGGEAVMKYIERKPERFSKIMAKTSSSDNESSPSVINEGDDDNDSDDDSDTHGNVRQSSLRTVTSTTVQVAPEGAGKNEAQISTPTNNAGRTRNRKVVDDSENEYNSDADGSDDSDDEDDADFIAPKLTLKVTRARPSKPSNQPTTGVTPWIPTPYPGTSATPLIPYPAPPQALASDRTIVRHKREWSLRDEDAAIKHMLAIRDEGKVTGETRFIKAVERLNKELGTKRTWVSFKNFWNRVGRARSGFDERRRRNAPLATSQQLYGTKKKQAAALAKKKQAQASKLRHRASGSLRVPSPSPVDTDADPNDLESSEAVTVPQQRPQPLNRTRIRQSTPATDNANRVRQNTESPEPFFVQWLRPRRVTIAGQLWLIPRYPGPDGTNVELPAIKYEDYDDDDHENGEVDSRGMKRKRDDSDDEKEDKRVRFSS